MIFPSHGRNSKLSGLSSRKCHRGLSALAILLLFPTVHGHQASRGYQDIRIPHGVDFVFPTPESELIEMRDSQNRVRIRQHAWAVFSGIIQPSIEGDPQSPPIFETWYTRSQVFETGCTDKLADANSAELELPLEIVAGFKAQTSHADSLYGLKLASKFFSDPGKSIRSNVLFNGPACDHIRKAKLKLYDASSLQTQLTNLSNSPINAPPEEKDIEPFPPSAVVVKAFWLRIDAEGRSITVWDSPDSPSPGCVSACPRMVEIKPAKPGEECNLPVSPGGTLLSSCFYNIPITTKNQREFESSITVVPGDVMVLVGLHVITKEAPDWVWSTFWWNPQADRGRFGSEKYDDKIIQGAWRNYLMDSTLSMETPREVVQQQGAGPGESPCVSTGSPIAKVCFNPYLEGNLPAGGQLSNCMNCHKQATFHHLDPDPRGSPQRGYLGSNAACFAGSKPSVMRLDYLWSLSPADDDVPLKAFLNQLQMELQKIELQKTRP
jgi:hypothetical protein